MNHDYLQKIIALVKEKLSFYKLDNQDFGKINTLFIKKVLTVRSI